MREREEKVKREWEEGVRVRVGKERKSKQKPCGILTTAGAPLLFLLFAARVVKAADFDLSFLSFPFFSSSKKKEVKKEQKRSEKGVKRTKKK